MRWLFSNLSYVIFDVVSLDKYFIFLHLVTSFYALSFVFPCISVTSANLSIFSFLLFFSL